MTPMTPKPHARRLPIHTETLRQLDTLELGHVLGGRDASRIITRCETDGSTCTDPGPK